MTTVNPRVVVVGGGGFYGRYLVEDVLHHTDASILVVARRPKATLANRWRSSRGRVSVAAEDHRNVEALSRLLDGAAAIVHCAGPFQAIAGGGGHPLGPLRAALATGVPYVDISEDRGFRQAVLDLAGDARIPVLTGASVVPGMQVLVTAELSRDLDDVGAVRCAAAPDTRRHRGDAMFRAMLHGAGRAFLAPRDGVLATVYGWSEPQWVIFPPPIGRRLVYQVYEMADLDVLVELFGASTVSFKAGSEFPTLNRALATAAAARMRWGWPRRPERFTPLVRAMSWLAGRAGDEAGGWYVEVSGHRHGQLVRRAMGMTAQREGGRIPALLAAVAVEQLLAGRVNQHGVPPAHLWFDAEQLWSGLARREVVLWQRADESGWHRWR